MEDLLRLEEMVGREGSLFIFPEYRMHFSDIEQLSIDRKSDFSLTGGTRDINVRKTESGLIYVVKKERSESDDYRGVDEQNKNLSKKDALVGRLLNQFAKYESETIQVDFEEPIGYSQDTDGNRRFISVFEGLNGKQNKPTGENLDIYRNFAFFVMLYNGIWHEEGLKDIDITLTDGQYRLFVSDFEQASFVDPEMVHEVVDYQLAMIETWSHPIRPQRFEEDRNKYRITENHNSRRKELIDKLRGKHPDFADKLSGYLASQGYFSNKPVDTGGIFEHLPQAKANLN